MEFNFERLRKAYRIEQKAKNGLARLEPDFYDLLKKYIEEEKQKLPEYWEKQDLHSLIRFKNMINLVRQFITLRLSKIILMALEAVLGEERDTDLLVGYEKELYRDIVGRIRRHSEDMLSELGVTARRPVERREEKHEGEVLNLVRVKILKDIPEFVGTDFRTYGPFRVGDVAELPPDVADILVVRELAEVIEDGETHSDAQF